MKEIYLKIIAIFLILVAMITNITYAADTTPQSGDDIISSADKFIEQGENNSDNTIEQDAAQKAIDLIYNILLAIGLVVAVICGLILGIQFMMSSSEGQAQVKEKLIPYGVRMCCNLWSIWNLEISYGTFTRFLEK